MDIYEVLYEYWGYENFRPLQEEIILSVKDGKDTLALMPTGGGKSLTYQVPALTMNGLCIVVTPLIALMKDQIEDLKARGIEAEAIYTGLVSSHINSVINKAIAGRLKFLYLSPERLNSTQFKEKLKMMPVTMFAVDEAHCISQWGYDFRPSYLKISEVREFFTNVPILALTATATKDVVIDIQDKLSFRHSNVLSKSFRRENIAYVVRRADDKLGELLSILTKMNSSAIVYTRRRSTTEELARFLIEQGLNADFYHAGLSSYQRSNKQEAWKNNTTPIIVATNAFGMGIDKSDVRVVVHYDIPESPEAYFQEAGRAGRDGNKAYAVLLYNQASLVAYKKRLDKSFPNKQQIIDIYNYISDYFGVEQGCAEGFAFEFNLHNFAKKYKLEMISVLSSLEILRMSGYMECTTDVHAKSSVQFLILRDQLYKIAMSFDEEKVIEHILRNFTGIFVQSAFIDEQNMADSLGVTRQKMYEILLGLSKRKILHYIPGNDIPYIVFLQQRLPASYINISRTSYEDRRVVLEKKMNGMLAYIESVNECRQLHLMRYFNQIEKQDCGLCDYCVSQKKVHHNATQKKQLDDEIISILNTSELEIKALLTHFMDNKAEVLERIRLLLEDERIHYKSATVLSVAK